MFAGTNEDHPRTGCRSNKGTNESGTIILDHPMRHDRAAVACQAPPSPTELKMTTIDRTRRKFVQTATLTAAATLLRPAGVHAAGSDVLRVGLVGCGSRGTGAASQALRADKQTQLTAMADVFPDRLQLSLESLKKLPDVGEQIAVNPERQFIGFDAFERLLQTDVDVVLLATPPHFRPQQLAACVAAGKHVFAEKPVAVDAPGVRSVRESCERAEQRGLSIVSGLCMRYSKGFQETIARIQDGAIGRVVALMANDYRGPIWVKPRKPDWTDMHWQMRNWYYFTWLSGDFNVEQHVHYLDVCSWVLGDRYPDSAIGLGGRQVRVDTEFGNIFDHHSVTYEYKDGVRLFSNCRQMAGCANDMTALVLGTNGTAVLSDSRRGLGLRSLGGDWTYRHAGKDDFYQYEHDALFASIRSGKPLNNGEYMANSTLLAIQGRMATYSGELVTWAQAAESKENLSPAKYEWGPIATPEVAVPGITKVT